MIALVQVSFFNDTQQELNVEREFWSVNGQFDELFMILIMVILEKDRQDKISEIQKHHNHLKFVKLSIYIQSKNI